MMKNMPSNIINNEEYIEKVRYTLETISDSLSKSLGYYGSNTIIEDKINGHIITKDGYTILKQIKFDDPISSTILDIIRNISRDLVEEVGDGSTSSIVIANNLFGKINNLLKTRNVPMKIVLESLEKIENDLITAIKKSSKKINKKNFKKLKSIASISNNNDSRLGEMIYDIYKAIGKDGFIYIEKSHIEEDYFEILNGIELKRGLISKSFANQLNKREFIANEPFILLCNDRLDSTDLNLMVDMVGNLTAEHMKPIVIIAKSFSVEFVSCWELNKRNNPNLNIALVDFSFASFDKYEEFEDLAIYTGATIYNKKDGETPDRFYNLLGKCDKIIIDESTTKIINGNFNQNDLDKRIEEIESNISDIKTNFANSRSYEKDLFRLQTRKANLKSKIAKFYIGGKTDIEKENKKYLIEDSISACRSALNYGYVSGGNLTIPKLIKNGKLDSSGYNEFELELVNQIYETFLDCYKQVLKNSQLFNDDKIETICENCVENLMIYNLKKRDFESDIFTDIINSSMTEIKILKSVFSIIGLIATSNQFISKNILLNKNN